MRPVPPATIAASAPRYIPALPRRRCDSAEFSLGYDAYVALPALHAGASSTARLRFAEWSRRVRRVLGAARLRLFAGVALAGFAWLCEHRGA